MITAVDTSVLIDFFVADSTFGLRSKETIQQCSTDGSLAVCDVAWAELAALFPTGEALHRAMDRLGIVFDPLCVETATMAGRMWKQYRDRGGKRTQVITDFLIAAHATCQADRLLTRDRGFARGYFPNLQIVDPTLA